MCFRYINLILQKLIHITKVHYLRVDRDLFSRSDAFVENVEKLSDLQKQPMIIEEEMNRYVQHSTLEAMQKIRDHFSDRDVVSRICEWNAMECPNSKTYSTLKDLMKQVALERIRREINSWEERVGLFHNMQKELVKIVQTRYAFVTHKLEDIENIIAERASDDSTSDTASTCSSDSTKSDGFLKDVPVGGKILLGVTAPIWAPVGMVVSLVALPSFGIRYIIKSREDSKNLKMYQTNKPQYMAVVTREVLESILAAGRDNELQRHMVDKLTRVVGDLRYLLKRLPQLIEAEKNMLLQLHQTTSVQIERAEELHKCLDDANHLNGKLCTLYLKYFKVYDINLGDILDWNENETPIASGQFGHIYTARLSLPNKQITDVALKVYHNEIDSKNAVDFVIEEECLRLMFYSCSLTLPTQGHFFVRYYRSSFPLFPCFSSDKFGRGVERQTPMTYPKYNLL